MPVGFEVDTSQMQVRNKFRKSVCDYLEGSEDLYDTNM